MLQSNLDNAFQGATPEHLGARVRLLSACPGGSFVEKLQSVAQSEAPRQRFVIYIVDSNFDSDILAGAMELTALTFAASLSQCTENSFCSGRDTIFGGTITDEGLPAALASTLEHIPKAIPIVISANVNHAAALLGACLPHESRLNVAVIEEELEVANGRPAGWLAAVTQSCLGRTCVLGVDETKLASVWEQESNSRGMRFYPRCYAWQEKKSTLAAALSIGGTGLVFNLDGIEGMLRGPRSGNQLQLRDVFELMRTLADGGSKLRFLHLSANNALRDDCTNVGRSMASIVLSFKRLCAQAR